MRFAEPFYQWYWRELDALQAEQREAKRWGWGLTKRLNRYQWRRDRQQGKR